MGPIIIPLTFINILGLFKHIWWTCYIMSTCLVNIIQTQAYKYQCRFMGISMFKIGNYLNILYGGRKDVSLVICFSNKFSLLYHYVASNKYSSLCKIKY
jgi:hypothetical protein